MHVFWGGAVAIDRAAIEIASSADRTTLDYRISLTSGIQRVTLRLVGVNSARLFWVPAPLNSAQVQSTHSCPYLKVR